ncbi:bifunctional methylenetetrahydrofolate dehydrogenase/methenyltetrahydrofolate cyclohydrolase FolD [bacterium]|jgi:methylenetetrahydrofolate dehydrogenase (NADP+)/methenyltetrahydrofolate cyclohydrolase|nr:bifunctional methylenetetrahydrofolate dehydrogenase/methenyltetrahydrofolate cyclohydrolase FolD [bacterium]MBT3795509.1 bifunctional methylenetetrahydrofolate dehydrogenase/methenyltetrahydrofolate cyclohydrolase FolD [bacterium]MBT4634825.1 bifunctional methylenetetrahydrofolate dehydrogenase/methenyltetrahydrofolate cyclohydrolase FolD [bacterium]
MSKKIIDGKLVSANIREEIKKRTKVIKEKYSRVPGLAAVLVGEDPASQIYVRNKRKSCADVGIYSEEHKLSESTTQDELLELINKLNNDVNINGILVQLPLPNHIDESNILSSVASDKDVDGFHPINAGHLFEGKPEFIPCTPHGIIKMLEFYNIDIEGKNAVVLGRSNIVGKPAAILLLQKNATVTICHSRTKNLNHELKKADIIVAAIGKAHFVKKEMVKEGAVVIDVGINRLETGKLAGDVDFDQVQEIASFITPVPGGVGPMTITMLLWNTLISLEKSIG